MSAIEARKSPLRVRRWSTSKSFLMKPPSEKDVHASAVIETQYCCQEGVRSGTSNCKVMTYDFQASSSTYWVDGTYDGVFRRKVNGACPEGVPSGSHNCRIPAQLTAPFEGFPPPHDHHDLLMSGSRPPYWVDANYDGVFRKAYVCDMPVPTCLSTEQGRFKVIDDLKRVCWPDPSGTHRWMIETPRPMRFKNFSLDQVTCTHGFVSASNKFYCGGYRFP